MQLYPIGSITQLNEASYSIISEEESSDGESDDSSSEADQATLTPSFKSSGRGE